MKKFLLAFFALIAVASAQQGPPTSDVLYQNGGVPRNSFFKLCGTSTGYPYFCGSKLTDDGTQILYNGSPIGGGGGNATVQGAAPVFTCSGTNTITCTLTAAPAGTVLANAAGTSGVPTYTTSPVLDGTSITNIPFLNLTGTLSVAQLPANAAIVAGSPSANTIGKYVTGNSIGPSSLSDDGNTVSTTEPVTAVSFTGAGTGLTALNASALTSGTVPVAQLPVATTSVNGIVRSDGTTILNTTGVLSVVGSALTGLNASALSTGSVAVGLLPIAAATTNGIVRADGSTITNSGGLGVLTAVGSALTGINASNITTGTLAAARVPTLAVTGGTIDGTAIGQSVAANGAFLSLLSNAVNFGGGVINNTPIGSTGAASGAFVSLLGSTITSTGNITATGTVNSTANTSPASITNTGVALVGNTGGVSDVVYYDSTRTTGNHIVDALWLSGAYSLRFKSDDQSLAATFFSAAGGQGTGITGITSNSGTGAWQHTGSFAATGTITTTSSIIAAAGGPNTPQNQGVSNVQMFTNTAGNQSNTVFNDPSRTANNRIAMLQFSGGTFGLGFTNDAWNSGLFGLSITGGQATGVTGITSNSGSGAWVHTGNLQATSFTGPLTGNVTGNVSGSAGTAGSATTATTASALACGTNLGDIAYFSAASTMACLPGRTASTQGILGQIGNGTISAAPAWLATTGTGSVVLSISPIGTGMATWARLALNQANGTSPMTITSSTPVANLTASNHPKEQYCGTTTTCTATPAINGQVVYGSVTLTGSPSVITGFSPAFADALYSCSGSIRSGGAITDGFTIANTSASSITITGVSGDVISYTCIR